MLIQVENLTHIYNQGTPFERVALREVNLEIEAGERIGILGPTGSGKSTLVQHLAGLLKPTAGRVLLEGTPIHSKGATARKLRLQVGLAFQYPEDQIFEQTVFREVAFGPRNLGLDEAEVAARVNWALEMVGLDPVAVAQRMPFTLSGGEMRRVALASILAMRPRVLILDEPTAGQDPQGRRALLDKVGAWQRETNMTLIVVSHALEDLARLVERVIALREGRVVADGPTRQVLSDVKLLRAIGLDVPQPVALLQALRQAGKEVRVDRFLPAEAASEIARVWGLRGSVT
ncbi:MAG: energy-coupling factor transporter ATPase [Anaerolineae bacterium]|nr:energy-coupling factor transporter ATPase [Anaerolineae bacterium]